MNSQLQKLINELTKSATSVDLSGFILCILFAFLGSVIITIMYLYLYDKKDAGSGVHNSFIIIGPSVTAMFLAIQFSLPLSLGLLGALSFIRFRTPIKDPEEVSYILLLIAVSIASATFNFALACVIIFIVLLALLFRKWALKDTIFNPNRGHIFISFTGNEIKESAISKVINRFVKNANLKNITQNADTINFHYTFLSKKTVSYGEITASLTEISSLQSCNIVLEE